MPTYVTLIKWTEQGIQNVRETTKRADQAKAAAKKRGGKISTILWTQGSYDAVAIMDFPTEDVAMGFLLDLGMAGSTRTETLRAFSAAEMERILKGGEAAAPASAPAATPSARRAAAG